MQLQSFLNGLRTGFADQLGLHCKCSMWLLKLCHKSDGASPIRRTSSQIVILYVLLPAIMSDFSFKSYSMTVIFGIYIVALAKQKRSEVGGLIPD